MNVTIQAVHFDVSEQLVAFVTQKVSKLSTYYDGILGAEVTLNLIKPEANDNKLAEITIKVAGDALFAKKHANTFEEATDLACDALRKQLEKVKEKSK